MIETLTSEVFAGHIGEMFRIHVSETTAVEAILAEVAERSAPAGFERTPFTLLLRGPRDAILPQRIYPVEHPGLGTLEIFLVTVGPDAEGMRYEAVFS